MGKNAAYEIVLINPGDISSAVAEHCAGVWSAQKLNSSILRKGENMPPHQADALPQPNIDVNAENMRSLYSHVEDPILLIARDANGVIVGHRFAHAVPKNGTNSITATPTGRIVLYQRETDREVLGFRVAHDSVIDQQPSVWDSAGGVTPSFRRQGIGRVLLSEQHRIAEQRGYTRICTGVANPLKPMMILNLQDGFDIVDYVWIETGYYKAYCLMFVKQL
jgi:GNAT superfamily N-acetyltransferase